MSSTANHDEHNPQQRLALLSTFAFSILVLLHSVRWIRSWLMRLKIY